MKDADVTREASRPGVTAKTMCASPERPPGPLANPLSRKPSPPSTSLPDREADPEGSLPKKCPTQ